MAAAPTIGLRHVTVVPTNFVPPSRDDERTPPETEADPPETEA